MWRWPFSLVFKGLGYIGYHILSVYQTVVLTTDLRRHNNRFVVGQNDFKFSDGFVPIPLGDFKNFFQVVWHSLHSFNVDCDFLRSFFFGSGVGMKVIASNEFGFRFVPSKEQKPPDNVESSNSNSFGSKMIIAFPAILLMS